MKQVTIKAMATIVVVDCKPKSVVRDEGKFYSVLPVDAKGFYPSKKNYRYIGTPSQLTEEDWKGIVETQTVSLIGTQYYTDYTDVGRLLNTATESGLSLIKANGVVMENPLGDKPLYYTDKFTGEKKIRIDWQKAQEQVWLNPHIFVKV